MVLINRFLCLRRNHIIPGRVAYHPRFVLFVFEDEPKRLVRTSDFSRRNWQRLK